MSEQNQSLEQINKRTIRTIKKSLKEVSTQKVLKRLGFTQQNLSYHLNEKNAEKANVPMLEKIADAIVAEKQVKEQRALKSGSKIEQLLNQ